MNQDERNRYLRAAIDEMACARGKPPVLLDAAVDRERLEDPVERNRRERDAYRIAQRVRVETLETRNRALTADLQAQAKRIQSLECRARGNALLLPEAIGRKNLTRDFAAQRYEGRLGCAPWQACG